VAECLEVVRFRAKQGSETALIEDRPAMVADVRGRHPGLIRAELSMLDDGSYLDVLRWRSRAEADAANADAENIPGFATWVRHVEEVLSLEAGEIVSERTS
jgi:Antibiotic biosynthesis monooxygenase